MTTLPPGAVLINGGPVAEGQTFYAVVEETADGVRPLPCERVSLPDRTWGTGARVISGDREYMPYDCYLSREEAVPAALERCRSDLRYHTLKLSQLARRELALLEQAGQAAGPREAGAVGF